MDDLKAMFRVCRHIKESGDRCEHAALPGMNFCFQHIRGKLSSLVRDKSVHQTEKLDFEYPGTRAAIQHNMFVIMLALNDEKLDTQGANTYLRILRLAEQNLTRWERALRQQAKASQPTETGIKNNREDGSEDKNGDESRNTNENASVQEIGHESRLENGAVTRRDVGSKPQRDVALSENKDENRSEGEVENRREIGIKNGMRTGLSHLAEMREANPHPMSS